MANRYFNPDAAYFTSSGQALSGGQLFFYQTGTNTKQNTYSDSALSVANANPVVLDSNGRAGSIFLQNLKYKVVLAPSTDSDPPTSPIWTMDPVYASDVSTTAQFQSVNGNPNTQLAGTKGSASIPASVAWDFTNNVLYVCTTTGNAASAVWTAVNPIGTAQATPSPSGRLTPLSATPVISTDQIGSTSVIYTPYLDNTVPIYNGTSFLPTTFTELTLTLVSSHAADTLYDVFIFSNSGTLTLVTGPAWSNSTAGSSSRGTGGGTTQLSMVNGHQVNAVSMTGRNGATTYTIGANLATYLGTIYTDHTAGQVTCHINWGQNRKFGIWNAFNRVPILLAAGDTTASWSYTTATFRASNNAPAVYSGAAFNVGSGTTCNGMTIVTGLPEEVNEFQFFQNVAEAGGTNTNAVIGIGYNSITLAADFTATMAGNGASSGLQGATAEAFVDGALGVNVAASLESGAASTTFSGGVSSMVLRCLYRG